MCDAFDQIKTEAIIGKEKLLTAAFQIILLKHNTFFPSEIGKQVIKGISHEIH